MTQNPSVPKEKRGHLAPEDVYWTRALPARGKWDVARDALEAGIKLQPGNKAAAEYARMISRRAPAAPA